jgi:eukaryotic-like serine/threonine-protein kinase
MSPERQQQIDTLYKAALERPGSVQELLAGVDPKVRREVEALLDATATMTSPPEMRQFGPYQVLAPIGKGGMGQVFRGFDTRLGRPVAIKTSSDRFSDRFEREARAISSLNHPHICTLYDVGTAPDHTSYLVMELVEGETLAARLKKGRLSIAETLRFGSQIAEALEAAHAKGIVHRDLKPANIMVTRVGAAESIKVLDFGLAKTALDTTLTVAHAVMGTPAYMAPEQAEGIEATVAADLFALGLVLYEMAAGRLPFPGKSLGGMLTGGSANVSPRLSTVRPDVPANLDSLVAKLLERDPARRPSSAAEVAVALTALQGRAAAAPSGSLLRPTVLVPVVALLLLAIGGGVWAYQRFDRERWVREVAIPGITKLRDENKQLAAFRMLLEAQQALPEEPGLVEAAKGLERFVSVTTTTPGTNVEIQDFVAPDAEWYALGTTPLTRVRIPNGYFRWKLSKNGASEFLSAPVTADAMQFAFEPASDVRAGMVAVPGGVFANLIGFIGWVGFPLPAFDIDSYEVTNREYQKFVDDGGYQKREYWKEKFLKDGKDLTWEQAMELFRDPTGRPGPSTWEAGHFPAGKDEYPVAGVSWYEASAYAAYAGKSLPVLGEWYQAAGDIKPFSLNQSNFGSATRPVRDSKGVGPFGTYDLLGNVREWSVNVSETGQHFILGGGWGTQPYQAFYPETLPGFDRSPQNGFRGVVNRGPVPPPSAGRIGREIRDFSSAKPVSDDVFRAYRALYDYDKRPLNAKVEEAALDSADWTREKVTIDAGYDNERLPVYLFLPKHVAPPYQTVVFFPSARVNFMTSMAELGDMDFVDYVIKSGRAVAYPIYRATYGRFKFAALPGVNTDREVTIQESKEVRRTLDYLETRNEIDKDKFGYLGVSQGTAYGVIYTAIEDRFKAVVFLDGGFFLGPRVEGRDQLDFAPRLKKPVLMVNGKYDFTFPPDQSQAPMFARIGTPAADKSRVVFDTPHDISQVKGALSKEVLAFLDKYLGHVK